jgi:hypothetical protein
MLVTRVGKIELRVPQDRQGRFRTERSNECTSRPGIDRLREMNPRTVWACHPVWFLISFSVAPCGRANSVQTCAAFDPSRNTGRCRLFEARRARAELRKSASPIPRYYR